MSPRTTRLTGAVAALLVPSMGAAQITEVLDATGDGAGNPFVAAYDICVDDAGVAYAIGGGGSDNAFRIDLDGTITEIIDATGDGAGNPLLLPRGIAVDDAGNVYVSGGNSHNVFRITPGGTITEIIDISGDGAGNTLAFPRRVAVGATGNVYVVGANTYNAFKIEPDGTITEIIDQTGDGAGNLFQDPFGVAVDAAENVYVTAGISNNAFKIAPDGTITEIIDETGDGANAFTTPFGIAVDGSGNVFIANQGSPNAFWIAPGGAIEQILDSSGDGAGNTFSQGRDVDLDGAGNLYVAGGASRNAFRITNPTLPTRTVTEIIDATGDGVGGTLDGTYGIAADAAGTAYVGGALSDNVFRVCAGLASVETSRAGTPANPDALKPGLTSGPVLGATWDPFVDHTTFLPGAVADFLGVSLLPANLPLGPIGTILCDVFTPPGMLYLFPSPAAGSPFAVPIPTGCELAGVSLCTQGFSSDGVLLRLTNALDITIGSP